jgi:D-arginine dehydrogenase
MATDVDIVVIGGGMAGASVAYWLAPHARVAVLEREPDPGYHSTGRSAAVFFQSYGSPQVRAITAASRAFFDQPPDGFTDHPLLSPRGVLAVADHGQLEHLDEFWTAVSEGEHGAVRLDPDAACERVPVLRPERVAAAVWAPEAHDIDVDGLLQGFLRGVRGQGGMVSCGADVTAISREGSRWRVSAGDDEWTCDKVVNAAGAWADRIAVLARVQPIGLVPKRRSAFLFEPPAGIDPSGWPLTLGAAEDWYIKPDAGVLLGSPANQDPVEPHDVRPDELDIAMAIDRIGTVTTMEIRRPTHTWAGLRSFVSDGGLVGGPDDGEPTFVWSAAQGGYGIQTAPAMGEACAALTLGRPIPDHLATAGVTPDALGVSRLRPT